MSIQNSLFRMVLATSSVRSPAGRMTPAWLLPNLAAVHFVGSPVKLRRSLTRCEDMSLASSQRKVKRSSEVEQQNLNSALLANLAARQLHTALCDPELVPFPPN